MVVSISPRLGLTRWSDPTDPFRRTQIDLAFGQLDDAAALYAQGTFNARPASGANTKGKFYWALDTGLLYYDLGSAAGGWKIVADFSAYSTTAQMNTLLNAKAPLASPTFTGTVAGITKGMVGLPNVDNTSDVNKPISTAQATALAAKADLVGGVVPTSQLPSIAIVDTFPVASQAAMLALTAQRGDVAVRTDLGKTFILTNETPTTLASWTELPAIGQVASVAGRTGAVVLAKADVGLGNVDNTSDANKPVSTATSTALGLKENSLPAGGTTAKYLRGDKTWQNLATVATSGSAADLGTGTLPAARLPAVLQADTGYVAVAADATNVATTTVLEYKQVGDLVYFRGFITLTNAITVQASGDITDVPLTAVLPAAIRPSRNVFAQCFLPTRFGSMILTSTGAWTLQAIDGIGATYTVAAGSYVQWSAMWMVG